METRTGKGGRGEAKSTDRRASSLYSAFDLALLKREKEMTDVQITEYCMQYYAVRNREVLSRCRQSIILLIHLWMWHHFKGTTR